MVCESPLRSTVRLICPATVKRFRGSLPMSNRAPLDDGVRVSGPPRVSRSLNDGLAWLSCTFACQ